MHLSEEEKKKQEEISDAVIKNQSVENLAEDDLREDEKIANSITMGLVTDPMYIEPEKENKKNKHNEEPTVRLMGNVYMPSKDSSINRFFKKMFGK